VAKKSDNEKSNGTPRSPATRKSEAQSDRVDVNTKVNAGQVESSDSDSGGLRTYSVTKRNYVF
jgi:hypothetical protein